MLSHTWGSSRKAVCQGRLTLPGANEQVLAFRFDAGQQEFPQPASWNSPRY